MTDIEALKNVVDFLEGKCKGLSSEIETARNDRTEHFRNRDYWIKQEGILEGLTQAKISTEKYMRRLKHEKDE